MQCPLAALGRHYHYADGRVNHRITRKKTAAAKRAVPAQRSSTPSKKKQKATPTQSGPSTEAFARAYMDAHYPEWDKEVTEAKQFEVLRKIMVCKDAYLFRYLIIHCICCRWRRTIIWISRLNLSTIMC